MDEAILTIKKPWDNGGTHGYPVPNFDPYLYDDPILCGDPFAA